MNKSITGNIVLQNRSEKRAASTFLRNLPEFESPESPTKSSVDYPWPTVLSRNNLADVDNSVVFLLTIYFFKPTKNYHETVVVSRSSKKKTSNPPTILSIAKKKIRARTKKTHAHTTPHISV